MPVWIIHWLRDHWLTVTLTAGCAFAILYVWAHRESLLYRE